MTAFVDVMRLIHIFELFQERSRDFPTQYAVTFLYIAVHEGCSNIDLMKYTGLSSAGVARNVQALSAYRNREKGLPGYNLVHSELDPNDNRRRNIFLTREGHELIQKFLKRAGIDKPLDRNFNSSEQKYARHETVEQTYFRPTSKVFEKK